MNELQNTELSPVQSAVNKMTTKGGINEVTFWRLP